MLISSPAIETMAPKTLLGTVKLNESNYLLLSQSFQIFIGAQNKLKHLLEDPPASIESGYTDWRSREYYVTAWLLNSMVEKVSCGVIFLKTAKKM